ncbi:MAG: polyphosphate kinase 2 family protein [Clostridia bacterium]|nr:polyphosphate kinase 2 family protein [Clostridia bacterium]
MSAKEYRYDGSRKLNIRRLATDAGEAKDRKKELQQKTEENILRAAELQERLMASGREGLIIAIQARDAAGKDSLIKKVFSGLNPAGMEVHSFKAPGKEELEHDYLWRIMRAMPPRGHIGVFNRSHYEDVLVTKVHHMEKDYVLAQRCVTEDFYERRYRQLRSWEQYLYENGYRVVKLFLNVSKEEQRRRFLDRMELPEKHWKLSLADMKERALWDAYDDAYEDAVNATATPETPWYVLPADTKWYTRYLVSQILADTLEEMDPQYPPLDSAEAARIPAAIEQLEREEYN